MEYPWSPSKLSREDYFRDDRPILRRVGDPFYNEYNQQGINASNARERTDPVTGFTPPTRRRIAAAARDRATELYNQRAAAAELAARLGSPPPSTGSPPPRTQFGSPAPPLAPIESPASGRFTPSADGTYQPNFKYPPASPDDPEAFNNRYTPSGTNPSGRQASLNTYSGDYGQTQSIDRVTGASRKYETQQQNGYSGGAWGQRQQPPGIEGLFEKNRRESGRREMTSSQRRLVDAAGPRESTPQRRVPAPDTRTQEERDYDLSERRAKNAEIEARWIAETGMNFKQSNRLVRQNEAERMSRKNDNIAIFRGNKSGNTSSPYYADAIKRKTGRDAQDTPEGAGIIAENDYRNSLPPEAVGQDGTTRPYNKKELAEHDRLAALEREYAKRNYSSGQNPNGQRYLPNDPRHSQYRFYNKKRQGPPQGPPQGTQQDGRPPVYIPGWWEWFINASERQKPLEPIGTKFR